MLLHLKNFESSPGRTIGAALSSVCTGFGSWNTGTTGATASQSTCEQTPKQTGGNCFYSGKVASEWWRWRWRWWWWWWWWWWWSCGEIMTNQSTMAMVREATAGCSVYRNFPLDGVNPNLAASLQVQKASCSKQGCLAIVQGTRNTCRGRKQFCYVLVYFGVFGPSQTFSVTPCSCLAGL